MNVNSISSASSAAINCMRPMQKPDSAKMAQDLFSKLDTKGQGYIEKSDLEGALSKVSSSSSSSQTSAVDQLFSKMDSDSDGKVTQAEMSATFEQIASELDGPFPRMRMQSQDNMSVQGGGGMPPPPPPPENGEVDEGFTQEQLSSMSQSSDSKDSKMTELFGKLANNFEAADSNEDGKVTRDEAMAYEQSSSSSGNSSASADSSSTVMSDMQVMKNLMDLLHSYGESKSNSDNLSVSA